ncbi:hypothetical protein PUNSTDRAFT_93149 [Punctularia strigosozonata HHB-11173 SS5]|uniref:Uncharacterized protein n=1 Tax=Punctularia strigosozonata (strain HHB-11173) TaxID=741275 RepID=R7S4A7_PUNST|nr:uncharacterized protein PUNSTDRAFT_93149 [Punctularia strigosozonata HHB-11173 SS5]EIN04076.1 hypothetical protein PUNSTDRAFT_93149 [Punctularia strigosozonata HHB-11173 SS5]
MASRLFRAYNSVLQRRPMLAQCGTAAFLFGAGDVLAQQAIEKKGKNHDLARTARLSFYGGCLFGPIVTKWFQFLSRIQFANKKRGVVYMVWMDQFLLTPGIVAFFFGSMSLLEGKGLEGAKERIKENYAPTLVKNWGVFIPAQLINFGLVPPHFRFVFVGVVSLFWNTYLSAVNAAAKKEEDPDAIAAGAKELAKVD